MESVFMEREIIKPIIVGLSVGTGVAATISGVSGLFICGAAPDILKALPKVPIKFEAIHEFSPLACTAQFAIIGTLFALSTIWITGATMFTIFHAHAQTTHAQKIKPH